MKTVECLWEFTCYHLSAPNTQKQYFSNFYVHKNHLKVLLKGNLWLLESGWDLSIWKSKSPQGMLMLLVGGPRVTGMCEGHTVLNRGSCAEWRHEEEKTFQKGPSTREGDTYMLSNIARKSSICLVFFMTIFFIVPYCCIKTEGNKWWMFI